MVFVAAILKRCVVVEITLVANVHVALSVNLAAEMNSERVLHLAAHVTLEGLVQLVFFANITLTGGLVHTDKTVLHTTAL